MLVLMCEIGRERLAIPVTQVVEVVPRVELQVPSNRPQWLAGHFVYRGRPTPVLDWTDDGLAPHRLSQRIVLLNVSVNGRNEVAGLVVQEATTQQLNDADVEKARQDAGLQARWGTILLDERGMFQCVDCQSFIPADMLAELFPN